MDDEKITEQNNVEFITKQECESKLPTFPFIKPKTKNEFENDFEEMAKNKIIRNRFRPTLYGKIIYGLCRKDQTNDPTQYAVSKISCRTLEEQEKMINLYSLIKEAKLLNFYDIYEWKMRPTVPDSIEKWITIVMEKLEITLEDYVQTKYKSNGPGVTENECKCIIKDLIQKLTILHKYGYIHADIKPNNIMANKNNKWSFIDYDIMLFIGDSEYVKRTWHGGTVLWTPPEMKVWELMKKFKNDDEKERIIKSESYVESDYYNLVSYGADIWQMGLIILYIITGQHYYKLTPWEEAKCMWMPFHRWTDEYFYQTKLLKDDEYDMNSDSNTGEISLRNYLISLYYQDKISRNLFNLLHDEMLLFDPRKRSKCKDILNHPWLCDGD